jgi:predicted CXXCH cytochrome family protein
VQQWLTGVIGLLLPATVLATIANTPHNLSSSGPGSIRASSEDRICIFCHTPHNASPRGPLWNRNDPGFTYTPYTSSTAHAATGQPTGSSILCLSCHDGTIALGKIINPNTTISMLGSTYMPSGPYRLGQDLSDDHPISFAYTQTLASQNGELVNPTTLTGKVKLDATGQLQCTSCHDPHNNDQGKFLVMSNVRGALCTTCHTKTGWSQSLHSQSTATWDGVGTNPWPNTSWTSVRDNACQNCHQPHSAVKRQRLLDQVAEEDVCSACHSGHVAQQDIMGEFNKFSRHPIMNTTGTHDPAEPAIVSARHVECVDCHNPHAANSSGSPAGPLVNVRGVNISGIAVKPLSNEYELCFRCHADSPNKPAPRTNRLLGQTNVRLEFNTANPSFHPVVGPRNNPYVPSLIASLSPSSVIKCTDCHNDDNGPGAGGSGPRGPHGSIYAPILERRYDTNDPNTYSSASYALCYKCHMESSILANASGFPHNLHVGAGGGGMGGGGGMMGPINAPCNTCHDPHGVSLTQGNSTNNSHLINFNTDVVKPNSVGLLRYEAGSVPYSGRCYLSCHGHDHNPETYGTMGGGGGGGGMY